MQTYIYDHYGYVVEEDDAKEFDFKGWHFKLESHDKNDHEILELRELVKEIDSSLFKQGVDIVENLNHALSCVEETSSISLVGVKNFNVSLLDLNYLHQQYMLNSGVMYNVSLNEIKLLWENKMDLIEETILPNLDINDDEYKFMKSIIIYYLGLGENAITYLNDIIIDFGPKIEKMTIAHKRLNSLNSFDLLNPFNLVLDSPMRDLGELYKNDVLDNESLFKEITKYNVNKKEVMILFARILFPTKIFDLLEDYYVERKDIKEELLNIYKKTNKKMKEISLLHQELIKKYEIRPIEWLIY